MILTCKLEITGQLFFHHAWYDDEGSLSWLVESVDSCDLVTLVARLHLPFTFENLQFSFQIHQLWWLKLWNFLTAFLLHVLAK